MLKWGNVGFSTSVDDKVWEPALVFGQTTLPKFSGENLLFLLKSIRQTAPLFNERVATSMAAGYTFNAPGEKYRRLNEL